MTTHNTEPENSDTNETVVQQPSASETPVTSDEVAIPANEQDTQRQEIQLKTSREQIEEEPARSFTDYIEEFRQNEVQFGSLLEEPQGEPFSALIPGEDSGGHRWENCGVGNHQRVPQRRDGEMLRRRRVAQTEVAGEAEGR